MKLLLLAAAAILAAASVFFSAETYPSKATLRPGDVAIFYYANDTLRTIESEPNYRRLFALLDKSNTETAIGLRRALKNDIDYFPNAIRREIAALEAFARSHDVPLAIFTNGYARRGVFLFADGARETRELAFPATLSGQDPVFRSAPLALASNFKVALETVGSMTPFVGRSLILVTKSHGTNDLAMMPRVSVDYTKVAEADFLRQLSTDASADTPPWAIMQGITKRDYWRAIEAASSEKDLEIAVVFRDACASGLSGFGELVEYPAAVRLLAHSGASPIYFDQVDYAGVFADMDASSDILTTLRARFAEHGIKVHDRQEAWSELLSSQAKKLLPVALFLPLLLWCLWIIRPSIGRKRDVSR